MSAIFQVQRASRLEVNGVASVFMVPVLTTTDRAQAEELAASLWDEDQSMTVDVVEFPAGHVFLGESEVRLGALRQYSSTRVPSRSDYYWPSK